MDGHPVQLLLAGGQELANVVEATLVLVEDSRGNGELLQSVELCAFDLLLHDDQALEVAVHFLALDDLRLGRVHLHDVVLRLQDSREQLVDSAFVVVDQLGVELELVLEVLVAVEYLAVVRAVQDYEVVEGGVQQLLVRLFAGEVGLDQGDHQLRLLQDGEVENQEQVLELVGVDVEVVLEQSQDRLVDLLLEVVALDQQSVQVAAGLFPLLAHALY